MTDYKVEELSIEVSNRCNCRCIHCSSGSAPAAFPNELDFNEHMRLIEEARALGATVLSLSGGDPILVSDIDYYVAQAAELGYERVLLYTSGIYEVDYQSIDQPGGEICGAVYGIDTTSRIDDIITAGRRRSDGANILTFIFSLHSHIPTVHDYIMNIPTAWHTATSCIILLVDMGIDVEVHMVPMLPNYTHISNMRDLCQEMGVKKLSVLRFVPQTRGRANARRLNIDKNAFRDIQLTLDREFTVRQDHPVELRAGCPIDFRHMIGATEQKVKPCHAGKDLILVRPNGDVHPCAAWKTLPGDDNVREKSLAEIWETSEVFNALRQFHEGGYLSRNPVFGIYCNCSQCEYETSCRGGCPAQRLHAYGGNAIKDLFYDVPDPLCLLSKDE